MTAVRVVRVFRGSEKDERANFDTFARSCVRRTRGIVEGAVCRKAHATVLLRVVALEREGLVGLHVWEIKPSMSRIEDEAQSFAYAVRITRSLWTASSGAIVVRKNLTTVMPRGTSSGGRFCRNLITCKGCGRLAIKRGSRVCHRLSLPGCHSGVAESSPTAPDAVYIYCPRTQANSIAIGSGIEIQDSRYAEKAFEE